jgi:subtilisin family serine protease
MKRWISTTALLFLLAWPTGAAETATPGAFQLAGSYGSSIEQMRPPPPPPPLNHTPPSPNHPPLGPPHIFRPPLPPAPDIGAILHEAKKRPEDAAAGSAGAAGMPTYVPRQLLVVMAAANDGKALAALIKAHGLERDAAFNLPSFGIQVARLRIPDDREAPEVAGDLSGAPGVLFAQPNFRYRTLDKREDTGNDKAETDGLQYALRRMRADQAQQLATGKGTTIALIDTGVDAGHPALKGRIAEQADMFDKAAEPALHGTALAGILVANGRVRGIAPGARLLTIRAFEADPNDPSRGTSSSDKLARALEIALGRGAKVVNLSFGGPQDRLLALLVERTLAAGIIVVAAAGNGGATGKAPYPAALPGVIAVTATDERDRLYRSATRGRYITVAAPGVDIFAIAPGRSYGFISGTSIAAAHVAGVVALLIESHPGLSPASAKAFLEGSAHDLGAPGPDPDFGAGRVDALKALRAATLPPTSLD